MAGKQPRKPASSFGEFASSFADELGSLAGAVKRGTKTNYADGDRSAATLAEREKEKRKRRPAGY